MGYQLHDCTKKPPPPPQNCVQEKLYQGTIVPSPNSPGGGDLVRIRTWLNNPSNDPSPGWATEPLGWELDWSGIWPTVSAINPASGNSLTPGTFNPPIGNVLPPGGVYPSLSAYTVLQGNEIVTKLYALLPDPVAYIVGAWCDSFPHTVYFQKACVMTGTLVGGDPKASCYQFDLPVPPDDLITVEADLPQCGSAAYLLVPITDYRDATQDFFGADWATFVTNCASNTNQYPCKPPVSAGTAPPCMAGDPFTGAEP